MDLGKEQVANIFGHKVPHIRPEKRLGSACSVESGGMSVSSCSKLKYLSVFMEFFIDTALFAVMAPPSVRPGV